MKIRLLGAAIVAIALAAAGCTTTSPGYGGGYGGDYGSSPSYGNNVCADCGTVVRIETVARGRNVPNSTGAVLGGIVGAVAGHEISDKTGGSKGNQNVAAVAGAVGGALAGNAIQNNVQSSTTYAVYIRMDDGRSAMVTQSDLGGIREGSYVVVRGGRVSLR